MNNVTGGCGHLRVERIGGKSVATQLEASSPLRLLAPRGSEESAWVFTSTFGGGLLAGDRLALNVCIDDGAACVLGTQSQTKIYRCESQEFSAQALTARVAPGGILVWLPDPVSCFAESSFMQRQQFRISRSSSLLLLDWLTSGRRARGERWAFRRYDSRTDVSLDGELLFRDAVCLDQKDSPIDDWHRMGTCDCFATLLLLGPQFAAGAADLLRWISSQAAGRVETLLFSASPLGDGAVVRVAGPGSEAVGRWIRQRLGFLPAILGGDPWARKW